MTGDPAACVFTAKPPESPAFDDALFQWFLDEEARIHAAYGPPMKRISGCAALLRWLMRQFPQARPDVTPVTLLAIPLTEDENVPMDSLRLTYADGTHKDVRVIEPPDDFEWSPR